MVVDIISCGVAVAGSVPRIDAFCRTVDCCCDGHALRLSEEIVNLAERFSGM